MNEPKVELSVNLVNAVIGYLVKQPFEQVAGLVSALQQEAQSSQTRDVPPPPMAK